MHLAAVTFHGGWQWMCCLHWGWQWGTLQHTARDNSYYVIDSLTVGFLDRLPANHQNVSTPYSVIVPHANELTSLLKGKCPNVDAWRPHNTRQRAVLKTVNALAYGASHGRKKGWRAKKIGVSKLGSQNESFWSLRCQDTKELLIFLAGSHQLVCLVRIRHSNELATDNLEWVKQNATRALSSTLKKSGVSVKIFLCTIWTKRMNM